MQILRAEKASALRMTTSRKGFCFATYAFVVARMSHFATTSHGMVLTPWVCRLKIEQEPTAQKAPRRPRGRLRRGSLSIAAVGGIVGGMVELPMEAGRLRVPLASMPFT